MVYSHLGFLVFWPQTNFMQISFFPAYVDCDPATCFQSFHATTWPFITRQRRKQVEVLHCAMNKHFCNCCWKTDTTQCFFSANLFTTKTIVTRFLVLEQQFYHRHNEKNIYFRNQRDKYTSAQTIIIWWKWNWQDTKMVQFFHKDGAYPKFASIWKGGCVVNRLL